RRCAGGDDDRSLRRREPRRVLRRALRGVLRDSARRERRLPGAVRAACGLLPPGSRGKALLMFKSKILLLGSFGLFLAAFVALIALGVARMESFNEQVHGLTGAQSRKIGTVSELFLSNGQRTALIDKLFSADDATARAGLEVEYRRAIGVFTGAVEKLRTLPVAGAERAARDDALAAAARSREIGERIAGSLMKGEIATASELNL